VSYWKSASEVKSAVEEQIRRLDLVHVLESPWEVVVARAGTLNPWCFLIFWSADRLTDDGKRLFRSTAIDASESPSVLEGRLRRIFGKPAGESPPFCPISTQVVD
jgi:hypothetical protein